MTLDFSQRVDNLRTAQGSHPLEDFLLNSPIVSYARHQTLHPGANETYLVVLAQGQLAFHKPFSGINPTLAGAYGQKQDTPPIHECAAWRLAFAFGSPFTELIPPCVLRAISGNHGSLCWGVTGDPIVPGAFLAATDQIDAAAFFDSLIAQ